MGSSSKVEAAPDAKYSPSLALLRRAHSPTTSTRIYAEKIQHRPLLVSPSARAQHPPSSDARAARRARREALSLRKRSKPRPLSASEKRKLCLHEVPPQEAKYAVYAGLNTMWHGYMREVLGLGLRRGGGSVVSADADGAKLASADFHGAEVEVVRSACPSRVGLKGIVVRDTMFTFVVVTRKDEVKTVPKERTVFRFEVQPQESSMAEDTAMEGVEAKKRLVFEVHGDNFQNRAPDRANKKFKLHFSVDGE